MEIKKRLQTPDSKEVNAVLLNDEGEEYPVFLESLHNTIIFPMLIDSGYVLTSLPYGFSKNGLDFDMLPLEKFTPDSHTEELMYNSIGTKMEQTEITKHVQVSEARLPIPQTNYTIFTREDLITYLENTKLAQLDEDFMPLNYFVAPDARFTLDEWRDSANFEYVELISNRRKMSLKKFHNLVNALLKINLPANYTVMDVLDAYFAWGIDGLQFDAVNRRRESRAFRLVPNRNVNAPMYDKTFGFVDGSRNILVPENRRNVQWRLSNKDPKYLDAITNGLKPNDTVLVNFMAQTKQDVTILEGNTYNVRYSPDLLIIQLQTYPTLLVKSPVSSNQYLDLSLALPNNREALYEHCIIQALAKMLYDYRKPTVRISSYDALKVAGCNPRTVLDYIITKYDMSRDVKEKTEDAAPQIFDYDIDNYLSDPKTLTDEIRGFLDDVVEGIFNIDEVSAGKEIEASVNPEVVYGEIYALHYVMGIPFKEIYDQFRTIGEGVNELIFSNGKISHRVDVAPLRYSLSGYKRDVMSYDLQNSKDCTFFTYVTLIAREVGDERARRHVGIEFYLVNKKFAAVKDVLEELEKRYESKVYSMIPDVTLQAKQMRMVHMFALSRYFEIAFKGTITWPKAIGGEVEPATQERIDTCRRYLERKIENITAYCAFTARTENSKALTFNAYCTNAYITPEYVIPRSDTASIREIPFYAAWFDWKSVQPQTWQAMVSAGIVNADFIPWENRYISEQFVQRAMTAMDSTDSLMYYYEQSNDELKAYPNDKDFISVTHPIEYMFPGLQGEERLNDMDNLPAPREGDPVVRLGITHDLKKADYVDKLLPTETVSVKDSYIRPFSGFDAMTLMTVENVFDMIPSLSDNSLTVMERSETIFAPDTGSVMHFSRITELDAAKYGIVHICDRNYMFRSTDGKLWEVRI